MEDMMHTTMEHYSDMDTATQTPAATKPTVTKSPKDDEPRTKKVVKAKVSIEDVGEIEISEDYNLNDFPSKVQKALEKGNTITLSMSVKRIAKK